ncbi:MAG: hypothetical protein EAZ89_01770, partial [Bacteroidetes bacterium]
MLNPGGTLRRFILIVCVLCAVRQGYSQERCANPELFHPLEKSAWTASPPAEQVTGIITLPVIIHVIHNGEAPGTGNNLSAARILSQITVLNEDFRRLAGTPGYNTHPDGADTEIEFCPAQVA